LRFNLLQFQQDTVEKAVAELRLAMDEVSRVRTSSQAVTLVAPTGAGKTVMAAAVLEALWWGDSIQGGDDELTVIWLSDLPNVNEQTQAKISKASDRLTEDLLVQVDTSFKDDILSPGRVYFLNTQKLSSTSNLVESSEDRTFTIWEVINRSIDRNPAKFLLIIDEAHRGMDRPTAAASEQAASIVQRFILGTDEMKRSPVVLGISATPQRFDDVVKGANRTVRRAEAVVEEVRASGLIKERIIVWRPEHGLQHSELTLLQRAAQSLQDYDIRWGRYAETEGIKRIHPVLVVQVEDKTGDAITATDLDQCITAIEEVTGPLHPDSFAHCFGDAPSYVDVGGTRRIRYIKPAEIDSDPQVMVVFFKTSLSTGWDCPRAEVIMSFRTARDTTFIAQLVGRMVRTPLAQRVDSDEVLNTVALYLPKYDRGAVQAIVKQLRAGDPEFLPGIEAEDGAGLVTCERQEQMFALIESASARVRTYVVPRVKRMPPVTRLERLAGALSDFDLFGDAPTAMEQELVGVLWTRLESRLGESSFEEAVERSKKVGLNSTTLEYLTGDTVSETVQVQSTARSLERVFEQAGARIGAGLHDKLWRKIRAERPDVDGDTARLYVVATLGEAATRDSLESHSRQLFEDWLSEYQDGIDGLAEHDRQEIDRLREHADAPTHRVLALPMTVRSRRSDRSIDFPRSLFQDDTGEYPDQLNSWETDVLEGELSRDDLVCWVRNKDRQPWALAFPYEANDGTISPAYPDFLFFRKDGSKVVVDLVDPHGIHLPDAVGKARGFARYCKDHGQTFGRVEMVIYDKDTDQRKTLDLKKVSVRDRVAAVTTSEHLKALFDLAGS
jgi:type III restriction enzyme